MTPQEVRAAVLAALKEVAPEVEPDLLVGSQPLRSQVDLDSMDWLNVIIGWHQRFGVEIPQADYQQPITLDAVVAHFTARLPPGTGEA